MSMEAQKPKPGSNEIEAKFRAIRRAMVLIQLLIAAVIVFPLYMYLMPQWNNHKQKGQKQQSWLFKCKRRLLRKRNMKHFGRGHRRQHQLNQR